MEPGGWIIVATLIPGIIALAMGYAGLGAR
jgi:hypothetical protein